MPGPNDPPVDIDEPMDNDDAQDLQDAIQELVDALESSGHLGED